MKKGMRSLVVVVVSLVVILIANWMASSSFATPSAGIGLLHSAPAAPAQPAGREARLLAWAEDSSVQRCGKVRVWAVLENYVADGGMIEWKMLFPIPDRTTFVEGTLIKFFENASGDFEYIVDEKRVEGEGTISDDPNEQTGFGRVGVSFELMINEDAADGPIRGEVTGKVGTENDQAPLALRVVGSECPGERPKQNLVPVPIRSI